jgi:ABC-type antimicrobial peptide transport system permease subunit
LGAEPGDVIALVLRDAGWMIGTGVTVGLPLAWLAPRAVRTMLFRLEPTDPWNIAAALAVLALIAFAAACLPAWRASRIDPVVALRAE